MPEPSAYPYGDIEHTINLGHDHYATPFTRFRDGDDAPTAGYFIAHLSSGQQWCRGAVNLRGMALDGHAEWDRLSEDPLTLTPSVLCSCGDHGFITNGVWTSV